MDVEEEGVAIDVVLSAMRLESGSDIRVEEWQLGGASGYRI